jgi:hypothetical protein
MRVTTLRHWKKKRTSCALYLARIFSNIRCADSEHPGIGRRNERRFTLLLKLAIASVGMPPLITVRGILLAI